MRQVRLTIQNSSWLRDGDEQRHIKPLGKHFFSRRLLCDDVKDFGVIIDSHLSVDAHITKTVAGAFTWLT